MSCAYGGHNVTGTQGLVAIDKVGNFIRFYDETLAEIKCIPSPEKTVHELAITPDHATAYVPLYGEGIYGNNKAPNNKILVLDLKAQSVADLIELGEYVAPHGMVYASNGKLWVVCDIPGKLLRIDPARRLIEAVYDCPAKGPHVLTMLPDETRIVISAKEGAPAIFDVSRGEFTTLRCDFRATSDALSHPPHPAAVGIGTDGITATPDGKSVLLIDNGGCDIHVLNAQTGAEIDRVALAQHPFVNPKRSKLSKLMYSPDGKHLIATAYAGGLAWLIEPKDLRRQTVISLAKGPMGIAYAADGRTALVSSHDSGIITEIDLAEQRAIRAVDGGSGIEVLAYY